MSTSGFSTPVPFAFRIRTAAVGSIIMDQNLSAEILSRIRLLEITVAEFKEVSSGRSEYQKTYGSSEDASTQRLESKIASLQEDMRDIRRAIRFETSTSVGQNLIENVTGIVGLAESVREKHKVLKFVWRFLLLLGIAATGYVLYATTRDYLKEPTLTKIRMEIEPYYEYPPFVLCHNSWYDTHKALSTLNMSVETFRYSLGYWGSIEEDSEPLELNSSHEAKHEFYRMFQSHGFQSLSDYFKYIATDLRAVTLLEALYDSPEPAYWASTDVRRAQKVVVPMVGVCYMFTVAPVDARLGMMNRPGLILWKFADRTDGLIDKTASSKWNMFLRPDAAALYSWPLVIQPSSTSYVKVGLKTVLIANKPDAPCHHKTGKNDSYTAANCMASCQNRLLKESFMKCRVYWITPNLDEHSQPSEYCNNFDKAFSNVSMEQTMVTRRQLMTENMKNACFVECPRSCEKYMYEASFEGEDLALNLDLDKAIKASKRSNLSLTAVYYLHEALNQGGIMITEEVSSYSFIDLVNNIGGTLGLFVGGTIMTFAQLVLFLIGRLCRGGSIGGKDHRVMQISAA